MADATFRHGVPTNVDYTPSAGDVSSGDIIVAGNTAGLATVIAPKDITNNELGAAAVGGVWDVKVAANYSAWTKVWWDAANSVLTTTSTNMAQFGYTVEASAAANAVVQVLHHPHV